MAVSRRRTWGISAVILSLACAAVSAAEFVIPWPPGGETDLLSRPLAPHMAKHLKQNVQVVNQPGQFGIAGVQAMTQRPADGSSFVVIHDYAFSVEVSGQTPANPFKDLVPVCGIVEVPSVLATNGRALNQLSAKDFLARRDELKASWTVGPTSTNYMMLAQTAQALGRKVEFRGYRSKEAAIGALLDGEVDLAEVHLNESAKGALPLVMLGLASDARDPARPDLPTLKELGWDVQFRVVRALAVHRATPADKVAALERACQATAAEPELAKELSALGARAKFTSAADMGRLLESRRQLFLRTKGPVR